MNKAIPWLLLGTGFMAVAPHSNAVTEVVVNLDTKHSVNGKDTFERQNHIKLHSTLTDNDWVGEEDKLKYMLEDLDVYLGRDNGITVWNFNQANQDPNRPGYADPDHIAQRGADVKRTWANNRQNVHTYDGKGDAMIGGQPRQHFLAETSPCCGNVGWQANGADAVGDFMGQFVNQFFRKEGEPVSAGPLEPIYFEVLNEPLYQLVDDFEALGLESAVAPQEVFQFHNDFVDAFRRHNTDVKIGGFTVAFPIFEQNNFERWNERMKLFMDTSGSHMDFYSTHFYDLEDNNRFKGSRIEATLDMIDHYSLLTLGETKEHAISEYGGRNRPMERRPWSALRDWWFLKTASPMLMQFMDRPDSVSLSIPFVPIKALWGTTPEGIPYNWRLLRQRKELPGETGDDWVFTEMVKFYELWSDVKGTRVDSFATDTDLLVDSYIDNNKAYVIFSNLTEQSEKIVLHKYGNDSAQIVSAKIKHLYLDGTKPVLATINNAQDISEFTIAPEATMIVEYIYSTDIVVNQVSDEKKYFATEYLTPINQNQTSRFVIDNVATSTLGETTLRVAVGRAIGRSLSPTVTFNDQLLTSATQISGDETNTRGQFFGVIEVTVPNDIVQVRNTIDISFPDAGGHIASVNMKVFSFSDDIRPDSGAVEGIIIEPELVTIPVGSTLQVSATVTPFFATNKDYTLVSSDPSIATVDTSGVVTALKVGQITITAISSEGDFSAEAQITVEEPTPTSIAFDDRSVYVNTVYKTSGVMTVTTQYDAGTGSVVSNGLGGIEYRLRHLTSSFGVVSDTIITDSSAIGSQKGISIVDIPLTGLTATADLPDGDFYFLFIRVRSSSGETKAINAFPIQIEKDIVEVTPALTFDDPVSYRTTIYQTSDILSVSASFEAGEGNVVTDEFGGVQFFLRELTPQFALVNDNILTDISAIDQQAGSASVSFNLSGLTPTADLPEGNFYFLFARFKASDGTTYTPQGVFPITIEQGETVEPSLTFDDASIYRSTEYKVGETLEVSVDYEMGSGRTVSSNTNGIRFFLRHLTPSFGVVEDIIVEDSRAIGQQSGTASASISLANVTPTSELPAGNFYFLFVLVESSDGSRQNLAIQGINIVSGDVKGDFDSDGDVDINDVRGLVSAIQARETIDLRFDLTDDGVVNILDSRAMMQLCTRTRCAP